MSSLVRPASMLSAGAFCALGTLCLLEACATSSAEREPARAPSAAEPLYGAEPHAQPTSGRTRELTARELQSIDALMDAAQRVRGLRFQTAVPVNVQDREAIMGYVDSQIEDEQLAGAVEVYRALGLLEPSVDVRQLLLRLMGEQVVGYYDTQAARLVVRDDVMRAFGRSGAAHEVDLAEARIVLVHELVHALQDQNLGLSVNLDGERSSDEENALRALIEGDATLAMVGFALERESVELSSLTGSPARVQSLAQMVRGSPLAGSELGAAPAIVRVPLLSAYVDGLEFVANLHGDGGWGRVDRSHTAPPRSTEHILHPERYALGHAPERPRLSSLPDALTAAGHELFHEDTLGELELGVYFSSALSDAEAAQAADGWGGDRLYAFRRASDGRTAVIWLTTWDSEADAREAAEAARRVQALSAPGAREEHPVLDAPGAVLIGRGLTDELRQLAQAQLAVFKGSARASD